MCYLRNIVIAAGVALASALLLQDAAVAAPPDWAPAHGYRNKHHNNDKHHKNAYKHHRYQRDYDEDDHNDEDEDDHDGRYGYHRDRDWREDSYRDNQPYRRPASRRDELRTVDQPIFVNGECTPKKATGAEAGAALGGALGAQIGSGNALATVAGTLAGAMLGSRADAAVTTSADEDCFRQVLERATDQEQVAWDNDSSSTHYELTPVRSYRRSGKACRELVTTIERHGEVREVYQTACRDSDGRWRVVD